MVFRLLSVTAQEIPLSYSTWAATTSTATSRTWGYFPGELSDIANDLDTSEKVEQLMDDACSIEDDWSAVPFVLNIDKSTSEEASCVLALDLQAESYLSLGYVEGLLHLGTYGTEEWDTTYSTCGSVGSIEYRVVSLAPCTVEVPGVPNLALFDATPGSIDGFHWTQYLGPNGKQGIGVKIEDPDRVISHIVKVHDRLDQSGVSTCEEIAGVGRGGLLVEDFMPAYSQSPVTANLFPQMCEFVPQEGDTETIPTQLYNNFPYYEETIVEGEIVWNIELKLDGTQAEVLTRSQERQPVPFVYYILSGVVNGVPFFFAFANLPIIAFKKMPYQIEEILNWRDPDLLTSMSRFIVVTHDHTEEAYSCENGGCTVVDCPCGPGGTCDYDTNGLVSPCSCTSQFILGSSGTCERVPCGPGYSDPWFAAGLSDDVDCSEWNCECSQCPQNTYSEDGLECVECPDGQQSAPGASNCGLCLPGQLAEEGTCQPCVLGTTSDSDDSCYSCPVGKYGVSDNLLNRSLCVNCPDGTESSSEASLECTDCQTGEWRYEEDESVSCYECGLGTYRGADDDGCVPTPPGKYSSADGASSPTECPDGYHSTVESATTCWPCEVGTFPSAAKDRCEGCERGQYLPAGNVTVCSDCDVGKYNPGTSLECLECPNGRFSDALGQRQCTPCPDGTYGNGDGATSCVNCPIGRTSLVGMTACVECEPLKIAPLPGSRQCQKCELRKYPDANKSTCQFCTPGTFSESTNATSCTNCPIGRYSNHTGQTWCNSCTNLGFADEEGLSYCRSCETHEMSTFTEVPASPLDCDCVTVYHGIRPESDTESEFSKDFCIECPEGGVCQDGFNHLKCSIYPVPKFGSYMASNTTPPVECSPDTACPGGSIDVCSDGFSGYLCAECVEGFYRLTTFCEACPASSIPWPMIGVATGLVLLIAFLIKVLPKYRYLQPNAISCAIVALNGLQVLSVFSQLDVGWPPELKSVLNVLSLFNFNIEVISPECSIGSFGAVHKTVFATVLPGVVYLVLVLVNILRTALATEVKRKWYKLASGDAQICCGVVFIFYVQLSSIVFSGFDCNKKSDAIWYLDADPSQVCSFTDTNYLVIFGCCFLSLLVYVIGVPAYLAIFLFQRRRKINTLEFAAAYGYLYERYERRWYWYEVFQLCRRSTILAVTTYTTTAPVAQVFLSLAILNAALLVHLYARPFLYEMVDRVETASLLANTFLMFSALVFHANKYGMLNSLPGSQPLLSELGEKTLVYMNMVFIFGMVVFTSIAVFLEAKEVTSTTKKDFVARDVASKFVSTRLDELDVEESAKLAALIHSGWRPSQLVSQTQNYDELTENFNDELLHSYIKKGAEEHSKLGTPVGGGGGLFSATKLLTAAKLKGNVKKMRKKQKQGNDASQGGEKQEDAPSANLGRNGELTVNKSNTKDKDKHGENLPPRQTVVSGSSDDAEGEKLRKIKLKTASLVASRTRQRRESVTAFGHYSEFRAVVKEERKKLQDEGGSARNVNDSAMLSLFNDVKQQAIERSEWPNYIRAHLVQ